MRSWEHRFSVSQCLVGESGLYYPEQQTWQTNGKWIPNHLKVSISSAIVLIGTRILAVNLGEGGGVSGQRTIEIKGRAANQHRKADPASLAEAQETTDGWSKLDVRRCWERNFRNSFRRKLMAGLEGWGKQAVSELSQTPATMGGRAPGLLRDFTYLSDVIQELLFSVRFFTKSNCIKTIKNKVSNLCDSHLGINQAG